MKRKASFSPAGAFLFAGLLAVLSCQPEEQVQESLPPNILFAISDDQSFPHAGAYGCAWVQTPAFDRVAAEGLLFTRAYTPNAKCSPSRACILTGRNSWQLEEAANHVPNFPAKFQTYVEALAANGYQVGFTGKGWAPGNPGEINGQRRQLTGAPYHDLKTEPPAGAMSDNDYAGNFDAFLKARPKNKPFCFWYGAIEPHRRYEYGAGIAKGGKNLTDIDRVPAFWPDTDSVRTDMLDYAFEIEYFDRHLGRMLQLLEAAGELDNTLIVVTADNGMPFPRIKGQEYEPSNHLPLAIMWKNGIQKPGRVIDDYVSFIDYAPTFLEAAGVNLSQTTMQTIQGRSLLDIFRSDRAGQVNPERDHVLIGKERHDIGRPNDWGYPIRGIVKDNFIYLQNFATDRWPSGHPTTGYLNVDGSPTKTICLNARHQPGREIFWQLSFGKRPEEEFYRLDLDPDCMNNLADNPEFQTLMVDLKTQLKQELMAQEDPRILGNGDVFDAYQYSEAERRNFYDRFTAGEKLKAGWVNPSDFESGWE